MPKFDNTQKQRKEILEKIVKKTNQYYEESLRNEENVEIDEMIEGII